MKKFMKKSGNKGFSLVELIIVIAIMAILMGVVGTQVLPYLEKSREATDNQVLNTVATAAVSSFATQAGKLTTNTDYTLELVTGNDNNWKAGGNGKDEVLKDMKEFIGVATGSSIVATIEKKMVSKEADGLDKIVVKYLGATSGGAVTVEAFKSSEPILEKIISK